MEIRLKLKGQEGLPKFSFVEFIFWVRICQSTYWVKLLPRNKELSFAKMLFDCHPMWSYSFLLLLISISFSELYLVYFFIFYHLFINFFWFWYHFFFLQIFVSNGLGVNVNFLGWRIFQIGLSVACQLFDLYCLFCSDCCLGCTIVFSCFSICRQGTRTGHPRTLSKVYFYLPLNLSFYMQKSWHVFWVII